MAGIKDIAKKVGMSISTVSYALNDDPRVTEKTREKIKKAAAELHYIPNLAGQTLKKQRTHIVGFYVSDFKGYFYGEVIDGVAKTLADHGYEIVVCSGEKSYRFLPQKLIDGAIILNPRYPDAQIKAYAQMGYKMITMDRDLTSAKVNHVLIDNQFGSKSAIKALIKAGSQQIILVTGPKDSYDSQNRLAGAKQALAELSFNNVQIIESDFTIEGGQETADEVIRYLKKDICSGVYCLNDELAIGLYDALKARHIEMNRQINLVGFDNDRLGLYLQPQLSSVDYSKLDWGKNAALAMIAALDKPSVLDFKTLIPTQLIVRDSLNIK